MKQKSMWVVEVYHSSKRIDYYCRENKENAEGLYQMNKNTFPKAIVKIEYKKVSITTEGTK